jgi:hypothetical protein
MHPGLQVQLNFEASYGLRAKPGPERFPRRALRNTKGIRKGGKEMPLAEVQAAEKFDILGDYERFGLYIRKKV